MTIDLVTDVTFVYTLPIDLEVQQTFHGQLHTFV